MSEGRRTLKANLGRRCTMCAEDPQLHGKLRPERIPHYHPDHPGQRLMVCAIHDRAGVRIPTA